MLSISSRPQCVNCYNHIRIPTGIRWGSPSLSGMRNPWCQFHTVSLKTIKLFLNLLHQKMKCIKSYLMPSEYLFIRTGAYKSIIFLREMTATDGFIMQFGSFYWKIFDTELIKDMINVEWLAVYLSIWLFVYLFIYLANIGKVPMEFLATHYTKRRAGSCKAVFTHFPHSPSHHGTTGQPRAIRHMICLPQFGNCHNNDHAINHFLHGNQLIVTRGILYDAEKSQWEVNEHMIIIYIYIYFDMNFVLDMEKQTFIFTMYSLKVNKKYKWFFRLTFFN